MEGTVEERNAAHGNEGLIDSSRLQLTAVNVFLTVLARQQLCVSP